MKEELLNQLESMMRMTTSLFHEKDADCIDLLNKQRENTRQDILSNSQELPQEKQCEICGVVHKKDPHRIERATKIAKEFNETKEWEEMQKDGWRN